MFFYPSILDVALWRYTVVLYFRYRTDLCVTFPCAEPVFGSTSEFAVLLFLFCA